MGLHPPRNLNSARRLCVLALTSHLVLCTAGCNSDTVDYPAATVAGRVTLDAQPVNSGRLNFMPAHGTTGDPISADVHEGQCRAEHVPLGRVNVTFAVTEEEGLRDPHAETTNIVPENYKQGIVLEIYGDSDTQPFSLKSSGR